MLEIRRGIDDEGRRYFCITYTTDEQGWFYGDSPSASALVIWME